MLTQMTTSIFLPHLQKQHMKRFCFFRIIWRFFGLSSGCVAFLMAIERYFALTKPFWYCKHFSNSLMYRLIILLWSVAGVLSFAPTIGFGIFFDAKLEKCARYRDATEPLDKTYAFLLFFVGKYHLFLCRGEDVRKSLEVHLRFQLPWASFAI